MTSEHPMTNPKQYREGHGMSTADNGGPAFPFEHGHGPDAANVRESGMTLRDWFAGQALCGLLASQHQTSVSLLKATSREAYNLADDMLAARKAAIAKAESP